MLNSIYNQFFAPRQKNEDIRNREVVLNVLLAGTLVILGLATLAIVGNYLSGYTYLLPRILAFLILFFAVLGIYVLSRHGRYRFAAWLLVGLYFVLAAAVGMVWSIALPSAILLYGLVVVLAGILLGPRYSLIGFGSVVLVIVATVLANSAGIITHDLSWRQGTSLGDVMGLSFMLGIIAAVSWLFNYQTARSLRRARTAESALRSQKNSLEDMVEKRTEELQKVQLEKIRHMYRFAELGQLSTALLHDLANHLTTLTLEIEGLKGQTRSNALKSAQSSIRYIDEMVVRVRDQLQGNYDIREFNVPTETEEVVKMLRHKAQASDVLIKWTMPAAKKDLHAMGEPIRFRQLMANLISNAIDAYYEPRNIDERRDVQIDVHKAGHDLVIAVTDWGRGIGQKERDKLFQPFFSTKQSGMGMGLYIAKQVVEEHFLGEIKLEDSQEHTRFVVTLPGADS